MLGDERWALVAKQLQSTSTDALRCILNLDAGKKGQELAVWIQEQSGQLVVGFGWSDANAAFYQSGLGLNLFLPDQKFSISGASVEDYLEVRPLSPSLTRPALDWIRQQAETRLGKKGGPMKRLLLAILILGTGVTVFLCVASCYREYASGTHQGNRFVANAGATTCAIANRETANLRPA